MTGPMRNGVDGASAERTRLAWRRTVLSTTGVSLLAVRLATRSTSVIVEMLGIVVVIAAWLAQMLVSNRRIQAMADPRPRNIRRSLPLTALLTATIAVLGIVLTLTSH